MHYLATQGGHCEFSGGGANPRLLTSAWPVTSGTRCRHPSERHRHTILLLLLIIIIVLYLQNFLII